MTSPNVETCVQGLNAKDPEFRVPWPLQGSQVLSPSQHIEHVHQVGSSPELQCPSFIGFYYVGTINEITGQVIECNLQSSSSLRGRLG